MRKLFVTVLRTWDFAQDAFDHVDRTREKGLPSLLFFASDTTVGRCLGRAEYVAVGLYFMDVVVM